MNAILAGDVRARLAELPEQSVHLCISSPPYWGLRSYRTEPQVWGGDSDCQHEWRYNNKIITHKSGETNPGKSGYVKDAGGCDDLGSTTCLKCGAWLGEHGLEPSIAAFIRNEVEIWRAVRRVLRDDGVLVVNIGDTYLGSGCGTNDYRTELSKSINKSDVMYSKKPPQQNIGINISGSLACIPERLLLAMQDDGWCCRSKITWIKGMSLNPDYSGSVMPESVRGWTYSKHQIKVKRSEYETMLKMQTDQERRRFLQNRWREKAPIKMQEMQLRNIQSMAKDQRGASKKTGKQKEVGILKQGNDERENASSKSSQEREIESLCIKIQKDEKGERDRTTMEVDAEGTSNIIRDECQTKNVDKDGEYSFKGNRMGRDSKIVKGEMLLLREEYIEINTRPHNTFEQGGATHSIEHSSILPDLQHKKGQQDDYVNIDCPGCDICSPTGGFVLRRGKWRPTSGTEMIYVFTKGGEYYADATAVKEIGSPTAKGGGRGGQYSDAVAKDLGQKERNKGLLYPIAAKDKYGTRNLRNAFWSMPDFRSIETDALILNPEPCKEAHFATFPQRLVEVFVKAFTSERGCCPNCGSQWARVVKSETARGSWGEMNNQDELRKSGAGYPLEGRAGNVTSQTLGWMPSCDHYPPPADWSN